MGRVLGPDKYVFPDAPAGRHAQVLVRSGWEGDEPVPYAPLLAFETKSETWYRPIVVNDRGQITVVPRHPGVVPRIYVKPTGLNWGGFREVVARSGSLGRRVPTTLRFMPGAPIDEKWVLDIRDLQNPWAGHRLGHGHLMMLELSAPGEKPERYVFDARQFGWRFRSGAAVLLAYPVEAGGPWTPAITVHASLGYRFRTRNPVLEFTGERISVIASGGLGSSVVDNLAGIPIETQIQNAFSALLVGGGLEFFEFLSVQMLASPQGALDSDPATTPNWNFAVGFDAVQFGKFFRNAGTRLLREYQLREDLIEQKRAQDGH